MTAEEKLDEIRNGVNELLQWKAALDERCKAHREKTDDLNETVFGNPGLKTQVQQLINCKKDMSKRRDFVFGILKTVVAGAILVFVFWLLNLYKLIG